MHAGYFTVINVTTVGFGDVTAATRVGKLVSGLNAFIGLGLFGVLVALITLAFQPSEFTGTAKPVSAAEPSSGKDHPPRPQGIDRELQDLVRTVGRFLETRTDTPDATIEVHGHGERTAHVLVEIVVRHAREV